MIRWTPILVVAILAAHHGDSEAVPIKSAAESGVCSKASHGRDSAWLACAKLPGEASHKWSAATWQCQGVHATPWEDCIYVDPSTLSKTRSKLVGVADGRAGDILGEDPYVTNSKVECRTKTKTLDKNMVCEGNKPGCTKTKERMKKLGIRVVVLRSLCKCRSGCPTCEAHNFKNVVYYAGFRYNVHQDDHLKNYQREKVVELMEKMFNNFMDKRNPEVVAMRDSVTASCTTRREKRRLGEPQSSPIAGSVITAKFWVTLAGHEDGLTGDYPDYYGNGGTYGWKRLDALLREEMKRDGLDRPRIYSDPKTASIFGGTVVGQCQTTSSEYAHQLHILQMASCAHVSVCLTIKITKLKTSSTTGPLVAGWGSATNKNEAGLKADKTAASPIYQFYLQAHDRSEGRTVSSDASHCKNIGGPAGLMDGIARRAIGRFRFEVGCLRMTSQGFTKSGGVSVADCTSTTEQLDPWN